MIVFMCDVRACMEHVYIANHTLFGYEICMYYGFWLNISFAIAYLRFSL